jgi:hypothetical protein
MTTSEMEDARTYWIRQVQEECFAAELSALRRGLPLPRNSKIARFNPFLQEGLIRLGGRLQFVDLQAMSAILCSSMDRTHSHVC